MSYEELPQRSTKGYVVEMHGVSYRVLNNVTLGFSEGLTVVAGPNGAGKTSLLSLIAGLARPSKGIVKVLGMDPLEARSKGLVAVSLHPPLLDPSSRVRTYLKLHFRLCGAKESVSRKYIELFGVNEFYDKPIYALSTGQRKRVDLARVFSCLRDGGLLLLDEPTEGLDSNARTELIKVLGSIKDKLSAIIVSTHDYKFASDLSSLGVSNYLYVENGSVRRVELSELGLRFAAYAGGGGAGNVKIHVKAVVRGRIPVSELRSVNGVEDVEYNVDVDWVLEKLGLKGLVGVPVIAVQPGGFKEEELPRGFRSFRLDEVMVEFNVRVSDYNALADVLYIIRKYGNIVHVDIGRG